MPRATRFSSVCAVAVMMRGPPEAPSTASTAPLAASSTMVGDMEESGRFPGMMKFAREGARL